MQATEVKNPNIFVDVSKSSPAGAAPHRNAFGPSERSAADAQLMREIAEIRLQIEQLVCSATWGEDCLYRGADYAPDFRCSCPVCRELYPDRRHPRPVLESKYSIDCQIETNEDPEFAEEFAKLRNDRVRVGSVFLRHIFTAKGGRW